jgi:hypothetical protein
MAAPEVFFALRKKKPEPPFDRSEHGGRLFTGEGNKHIAPLRDSAFLLSMVGLVHRSEISTV